MIVVTKHVNRQYEISALQPSPTTSSRSRLIERIFAKLPRGVAGKAGKAGKVGLALYFCKQAMQSQQGDVEVVDSPEWPTSFRVRLPVTRA